MKKIKQSGKVVPLFVLLLVIICSPQWLLQYKNENMLGEAVRYPVEMAEYDTPKEVVENYTLWERLKAIRNADAVSRTDIAAGSRTDSAAGFQENAGQGRESVLQILEKQMVSLQKHGALPMWDFSASAMQQVLITKESYLLDEANPELTLNVWSICAEYENFFLSVYLDAQLETLYDINLTSKTEFSSQYTSELFEEGYLEYLMAFEEAEDEEEIFETRVYYGMYKIYLYTVSVNKKTGNYTSYCFNESLKDNPADLYAQEEFIEMLERLYGNYAETEE